MVSCSDHVLDFWRPCLLNPFIVHVRLGFIKLCWRQLDSSLDRQLERHHEGQLPVLQGQTQLQPGQHQEALHLT